jgi:hypothetical protein
VVVVEGVVVLVVVVPGVVVVVVPDDVMLNVLAELFQYCSAPQPVLNTPILTVYTPVGALAGTAQLALNERGWPATNAWLSRMVCDTWIPDGLYSSMSTSALPEVGEVTEAVTAAVVPATTEDGETVAEAPHAVATVVVGAVVVLVVVVGRIVVVVVVVGAVVVLVVVGRIVVVVVVLVVVGGLAATRTVAAEAFQW